MKQIAFHRLQAQAFKAYVDLTVVFDEYPAGCYAITGRNLVTPRLGSNGAGKSTLWDALCYALFGYTTKRLRAADVQPYGSSANPLVAVNLSVNGQRHTIRRHAVPHALSVDGERCNQDRVDNLLGFGLDLFLQTVILAQGCPLFLDLEPRNKLALLSEVLRLDRFEGYSDRAKIRLNELEIEERKLAMRHGTISGAIEEANRNLQEAIRRGVEFDQQQMARTRDARRLAWETAQKATQAQAELADVRQHMATIGDAYDAARDRVRLAEARHADAMALQAELRRSKFCPTCGQPLLGGPRHATHGPDVVTTQRELREATDAFQPLDVERVRLQMLFRSASDRELHATRASLAAEAAMHQLEGASDPFKDEARRLAERLDALRLDEAAVANQRAVAARLIARMTPWVPGFREIRLIVLDELLTSLSLLTTSYANEMGLPVDVAFSIERTAKAGHAIAGIHASVEGAGKFEAWSGGEAQRLRLATSLALSATLLAEAGLTIPLLALDEPSASLSPEGLQELVGFLAVHAQAEGRTIFLTDQRRVSLPTSIELVRDAAGVRFGP